MGGGIPAVGTYRGHSQNEVSTVYNGPYKLVVAHQGTRRRHWHLVYISYNRQWGFNSRLGRIIRSGSYTNVSINCLSCLREYLYTGDGRQVLSDVLSDELIKTCQCAKHSCGMEGLDKRTAESYKIDCAERGNSIFPDESGPSENEHARLVDATDQTDEPAVREQLRNKHKILCKDQQILHRRENSQSPYGSRTDCQSSGRNSDIILLLCENGAFSEAEAMEVLARTPEGIEYICGKPYAERIKNQIHIARILVFQESLKQRFERAKAKFEKENELLMNEDNLTETEICLKSILESNNIDEEGFFKTTFLHFQKQTNKKNNLFFIGPPSTGKTMIMSSLVDCHFNYCRLTGLTPNSSFNFSGLLHCNACFMDECKLTENQFEQWKLLASGMPTSTDIKYKDRCDVKNCVLYTCSNYDIATYCSVPMAKEAVNDRTITFSFTTRINSFVKIAPHVWERLWKQYGLEF